MGTNEIHLKIRTVEKYYILEIHYTDFQEREIISVFTELFNVANNRTQIQ